MVMDKSCWLTSLQFFWVSMWHVILSKKCGTLCLIYVQEDIPTFVHLPIIWVHHRVDPSKMRYFISLFSRDILFPYWKKILYYYFMILNDEIWFSKMGGELHFFWFFFIIRHLLIQSIQKPSQRAALALTGI